MRKLLLILFCVSFLGVKAQEEYTPVYTDTVDIVDFLVSVYNEDSTFLSKEELEYDEVEYHLENVVVNVMLNYPENVRNDGEINLGLRKDGLNYFSIKRELIKRLNIKSSLIHFKYPIRLSNCFFNGVINFNKVDSSFSSTGEFILKDISFNIFSITSSKSVEFRFENCILDRFSTYGRKHVSHFTLDGCTIKKGLFFSNSNFKLLKSKIPYTQIYCFSNSIVLDSCEFLNVAIDSIYYDSFGILRATYGLNGEYINPEGINLSSQSYTDIKNSPRFFYKLLFIRGSENSSIEINNCFGVKSKLNQWVQLIGEFENISITNNNIPAIIYFGRSIIKNRYSFYNNTSLSALIVHKLIYPEFENELDWLSLSNFKLGCMSNDDKVNSPDKVPYANFYTGNSSTVYKNEKNYNFLIKTYKQVNDIFKKQGNTIAANGCYAEMKQVETRRWRYLYEQNPTFEGLFRWQLNAFLSYFTDYGTNPAKAVIKSGWVILLFAIFYLFFPSDWGVSNRSQLLSKVKDLVNKNREKSLLATLGFVLYSAFIHVINALTLSLNAFTTLGFGDIPTHGAARYVTIVQGFIGWFLLTIFSVSLINQVLG